MLTKKAEHKRQMYDSNIGTAEHRDILQKKAEHERKKYESKIGTDEHKYILVHRNFQLLHNKN